VAELDEQSSARGMHSAGRSTDGKHCGPKNALASRNIYNKRKSLACPRYGDVAQGSAASRFFPSFGYYAKAAGRVDDAEVKRLEKLEKRRAKATDPIEIARLDGRIKAQRKIVEESDNGVPRGERHAGCEELYWRANKDNPFGFDRVTREAWEALPGASGSNMYGQDQRREPRGERARGNVHPTVKSIEMMLYLIKLSGGDKIGDICFGSGGVAIACQILGLDFWGAEFCPEAVEITRARLAYARGLSLTALEELKLTGTWPAASVSSDPRQISLF
jgi:hypothetical protein